MEDLQDGPDDGERGGDQPERRSRIAVALMSFARRAGNWLMETVVMSGEGLAMHYGVVAYSQPAPVEQPRPVGEVAVVVKDNEDLLTLQHMDFGLNELLIAFDRNGSADEPRGQ